MVQFLVSLTQVRNEKETRIFISLQYSLLLLATKYRTWEKEITNTKKIIGNWFLELEAFSPVTLGPSTLRQFHYVTRVASVWARPIMVRRWRPQWRPVRLTLPGPSLLVKVCVSQAQPRDPERPNVTWASQRWARETEDWLEAGESSHQTLEWREARISSWPGTRNWGPEEQWAAGGQVTWSRYFDNPWSINVQLYMS